MPHTHFTVWIDGGSKETTLSKNLLAYSSFAGIGIHLRDNRNKKDYTIACSLVDVTNAEAEYLAAYVALGLIPKGAKAHFITDCKPIAKTINGAKFNSKRIGHAGELFVDRFGEKQRHSIDVEWASYPSERNEFDKPKNIKLDAKGPRKLHAEKTRRLDIQTADQLATFALECAESGYPGAFFADVKTGNVRMMFWDKDVPDVSLARIEQALLLKQTDQYKIRKTCGGNVPGKNGFDSLNRFSKDFFNSAISFEK